MANITIENMAPNDNGVYQVMGTGGDDNILILQTERTDSQGNTIGSGGAVFGGGGDDVYNLWIDDDGTQTHTYDGGGDDVFNIRHFSTGTEVISRGDYSNGAHIRTGTGADVINFQDLGSISGVTVGRLEDLDHSQDIIRIGGVKIDLRTFTGQPQSINGHTVRVVSFNGNHNDPNAQAQQWLLIETSAGGYVFYALEGARIDMFGQDGLSGGAHERHFISRGYDHGISDGDGDGITGFYDLGNAANADLFFDRLRDVRFVDPINTVPLSARQAHPGANILNDTDSTPDDVKELFVGQSGQDLMAGGLNNDKIDAKGCDDIVWGGSGSDTILGRDGNDTLWGGAENDTLRGHFGNDVLHGDHGSDSLQGGYGNDQLNGGAGNDLLIGSAGHDTLRGNDGFDTLMGGAGHDAMDGANGNDVLHGGAGNDTIAGGAANDNLNGNTGGDRLWAGDGNDSLSGGDGDDVLHGGNGTDTLNGSAGNDLLFGNVGADFFVFATGNDTDQILSFQNNIDTINFSRISGVSSVAQANSHARQIGNDVVFDFGNDDILIVKNITIAALADDMIFT